MRTLYFPMLFASVCVWNTTDSCPGSESTTPSAISAQYLNELSGLKQETSNIALEGLQARKLLRPKSVDEIANSPIEMIPHNLNYSSPVYFKTDGRSMLHDYSIVGEDFIERLTVIAPTGDFVLRKNSQNAKFYLEFTKLNNSFVKGVNGFNKDVASKTYTISSVDASDIMGSSGRFIRNVIPENALYKIDFSLPISPSRPFSLAGWFTVDPSRMWSIREYRVEKIFSDPKALPLVEYSRISYADNVKLPTPHDVYNRVNVSDGTILITAFRVTKWSYNPVSPDVFQLDAYGLGFLNKGRSTSGYGIPYWMAGFGVVAIFLGAAWKSSRSRRAV